jgi:predicted AlkP superfamily pyrophosphatase or phosphodiesterase
VLLLWLLAVALVRPARVQVQPRQPAAPPPATPTRPADRRVVIITVDGLRPDLLLRAEAPHIRRLMASGSFTLWARTVREAYTLPAHASILTGVVPQKHGILWNELVQGAHPLVPTLFDVAKGAGLTTALVTGKTKFVTFDRAGSIDLRYIPHEEPIPDRFIAMQGVNILRQHRPHVLFVHLADTDTLGHALGWGTPEQLRFIEEADRQVGVVVAAIERLGLGESTLVLLTADHGGAGIEHLPDDPRSAHVPWIVAGPGVRRDFDLTRFPDLTVSDLDTFAMACHHLGLRPPAGVEGKIVWQAFDTPRELLRQSKD